MSNTKGSNHSSDESVCKPGDSDTDNDDDKISSDGCAEDLDDPKSNRRRECSKCQEVFTIYTSYERHMRTHHKKRKWIKCPEEDCSHRCLRMDHLRRHIFHIHKRDPAELFPQTRGLAPGLDSSEMFKCPLGLCKMKSKRKYHVYRHIRNVHRKDPEKVMADIFNVRPKKKEVPNLRIKCTQPGCEEELRTKSRLRYHLLAIHSVDPVMVRRIERRDLPFKCSFKGCGKTFPRKDKVYRHIRNVHKMEPREVLAEEFFKRSRRMSRLVINDTEESGEKAEEHENKLDESLKGDILGREEEVGMEGRDEEIDGREEKMEDGEDEQGDKSYVSHEFPKFFSDSLDSYLQMFTSLLTQEELQDLEFEISEEGQNELCGICCLPFLQEDQKEAFIDSFHFVKFVTEMIPDANSLKRWRKLSYCPHCQFMINSAMDRKLEVDEVEFRIANFKEEMGHDMRNLQERLTEYCLEIMKIAEVVNSGDFNNFEINTRRERKKSKTDIVFLKRQLRDAVLSVTENVKYRVLELGARFFSLTD